MTSLLGLLKPLQTATLQARARKSDATIGTRCKQGFFQVGRYNQRANSPVIDFTPMTDFLPMQKTLQFLDSL